LLLERKKFFGIEPSTAGNCTLNRIAKGSSALRMNAILTITRVKKIKGTVIVSILIPNRAKYSSIIVSMRTVRENPNENIIRLKKLISLFFGKSATTTQYPGMKIMTGRERIILINIALGIAR